jgi:hypothetical protein
MYVSLPWVHIEDLPSPAIDNSEDLSQRAA